jgi:hypothetical protein
MNFNGNFNRLGFVDTKIIKELVLSLTEDEWGSSDWRQKEYEAHKHTQTISLIFDKDFRHQNPTKHPMYKRFKSALKPIKKIISKAYQSDYQMELYAKYGKGFVVRANLVRLLPNGNIPSHYDRNFTLSHGHRIHLPIITNKGVLFTVNDEVVNIKEGELTEINNKQYHHVINNGNEIRTHLIIDWVIPNEMCCCGKKWHPNTPCSPEVCKSVDYAAAANVCSCFK